MGFCTYDMEECPENTLDCEHWKEGKCVHGYHTKGA